MKWRKGTATSGSAEVMFGEGPVTGARRSKTTCSNNELEEMHIAAWGEA